MFNYVRLSDGGIDRLDGVRGRGGHSQRHCAAPVAGLPGRLRRVQDPPQIREAIAHIVPGMADLEEIDVAKREFHIRGRLLHTPAFKTADGRARFRVAALPDATRTNAPFMLSTVRSEGQFNSIVYEYEDSYRLNRDRWVVMMNPDDMTERRLDEGDAVTLISTQGRMHAVRVQPYDLPRGDLMAYFPEANVLTSTAVDPRSKTPAFKSTPVWIEDVRAFNEAT